jgi:hypothetical protein
MSTRDFGRSLSSADGETWGQSGQASGCWGGRVFLACRRLGGGPFALHAVALALDEVNTRNTSPAVAAIPPPTKSHVGAPNWFHATQASR